MKHRPMKFSVIRKDAYDLSPTLFNFDFISLYYLIFYFVDEYLYL